MTRQINKIILHHSGGIFSRIGTYLEGLRNYLDNPGRAITPYHFIVGDKEVFTGRDIESPGNVAEAADSLDVCLFGDFDRSSPSDTQMSHLIKLLVNQCRSRKLKAGDIYGHRNIEAGTTCPGRKVSVDEIRRNVNEYLFAGKIPLLTSEEISFKVHGEAR